VEILRPCATLESSDLGVVCFWGIVLESGNMKRYLVTYAQNRTPVHVGFLKALYSYCEYNEADGLIVVRGHYKNPTNPFEADEQAEDDWWAPEVTDYLVDTDHQLCPNLCLYASYRVQPTASNPLSGLNVYVGQNSAIIGHTKRALECIPTDTRYPRIAVTTSACTLPNYSASRMGAKGAVHHVLGALVVEIEDDGTYFLRHVSANDDGSFTDLDKLYQPGKRVKKAPRALGLVLGDLHVGKEDWSVIRATRDLCRLLRPQHLVLHDVLDFTTRNHHDKSLRSKIDKFDMSVCHEVSQASRALTRMSQWGADSIHVVRSNHDEAAERWLNDTTPYEDPANAAYYHAVWSRSFAYYAEHGGWPNVFEMEARRLGVPAAVLFLRRNESLRIAGIECGYHGDKGLSGSRGSPGQYAKLGCKTVTGHTHSPRIQDGAFTVGVTAKLDHGYNLLPSAWMNAHCVIGADGKRQMVFVVNGKYRGSK
jgi:hypothetical protein